MKLWLSLVALIAATPASAERITAYWTLEPTGDINIRSASFDAPFMTQRILPVKLVRLSASALPAGDTTAVPAGTLLYLVVNAEGKSGYCTLKDWSSKNQAKSLFIPALDKRPCFADRDGDGAFDASFSVFDAYTLLSPPQPRGSINAAKPMTNSAAYETVDIHEFPMSMTLSYRLLRGKTAEKTRLRATLDRPGHSEYSDLRGTTQAGGTVIPVLGTLVVVKSTTSAGAEIEIAHPPRNYIVGYDTGTIFLPMLPDIAAMK